MCTVGGHPLRELVDGRGPRRPGRKEQLGRLVDVEGGVDGDRHRGRRGHLDTDGTQIPLPDEGIDQRTLTPLHLSDDHNRAGLPVAGEFGGGDVGKGVHLVGAEHRRRGIDNGRRVAGSGFPLRRTLRLCSHSLAPYPIVYASTSLMPGRHSCPDGFAAAPRCRYTASDRNPIRSPTVRESNVLPLALCHLDDVNDTGSGYRGVVY